MQLPRHLPDLDSRRMARAIWHRRGERPPWLPTWKFAVCLLGATVIAFLPDYPGLEAAPRRMFFILLFAAGLWVTEAMPAFAVALLVIGLEILLLGREGGVFAENAQDWQRFVAPWASPLIWLFLAGFVLSAAASKTRLDRLLTDRLLRAAGDSPRRVLAAVMGATFVLSAFMSNTATTAMLFVVLVPLLQSLDADDPFASGLCLGVPIAANLGGMCTIIGSPPNAIALGLLGEEAGLGFLGWMGLGAPPALLAATVAWWWLLRRFPARSQHLVLPDPPAAPEGRAGQVLRWRRRLTAGTVLATIALWMTTGLHGMPVAVVSFLPICLLPTAGVLDGKDIRGLPWDVLMLLGGGLALGVGVADTGLAEWLVAAVPFSDAGALVLGLILAYGTVIVSNVMSNTAAANVVLPLAVAMAATAPIAVAVPVALAASAAMALPISTPPNAIAYASGRLGSREFLRVGIAMALIMPPVAVLWVQFCLSVVGG